MRRNQQPFVMLCMEESINTGGRVCVKSSCGPILGLWAAEDTSLQ